MVKFKWLAILILLLFAVQPSFGEDRAQVHGVWKLVSYDVEIQATGQKEPPMGKNPTGYVIFTPEGRVFFVLTGEGRKAAKPIRNVPTC